MAGGNSLQFKLGFTADTSQADSALKKLNESIKAITDRSKTEFGLDAEFDKAAASAEKLQQALQKAYNSNTGKLDMGVFNEQLRQSGTTLEQLTTSLLNAGTQGTAAFRNLALTIAQTNVPIKQMNTTLKTALTTLTNTIKWEAASGIVHGLESAFSGAISYAKNLNSSLNDIRIVTGQSAEDMTKFAQSANKAAKELSTTTKAYADAALIYYQQGDSDEMAAKKAAITIKAANASFGSSASEMSEYLTAVWNSFQVGSDQLEHYVDIMANLGANTATSLEEIATSMQKVAATANTVGVSMEQVSSIIATVSSVTRESAESIGTSYKTIFARIGDLKLGKTDEDGVGLGTVSKQLQSIGVNVLDANGELREMGDIITDLGTKWQTMNGATKTAVAQAVAGKRQYTQLMALFENWPKYQENLNLAENSDGSLQKMADIYAESWEAASARVQAAMEGLYSKLINDKAMIQMTNATADVIKGIEGIVSSMGGLPGILSTVANLMATAFGRNLTSAIDNISNKVIRFGESFKGLYTNGNKLQNTWSTIISAFTKTTEQREYMQMFNTLQRDIGDQKSPGNALTILGQQTELTQTLIDKKVELTAIEGNLSDAQRNQYQAILSGAGESLRSVEAMTEAYKEQETTITKLQNQLTSGTSIMAAYSNKHGGQQAENAMVAQAWMAKEVQKQYSTSNQFNGSVISTLFGQGTKGIQDQQYGAASALSSMFNTAPIDSAKVSLDQLISTYSKMSTIAKSTENAADSLSNQLNFQGVSTMSADERIKSLANTLETLKQQMANEKLDISWVQQLQTDLKNDNSSENLERIINKLREVSELSGNNVTSSRNWLNSALGIDDNALIELTAQLENASDKSAVIRQFLLKIKEDLNQEPPKINKFAQGVTKTIQSITSFSSAMMTSSNTIANWDTSSLTSKISGISMMFTNVANQLINHNPWGAVAAVIGVTVGAIIADIEKAKKEAEKLEKERKENVTKKIDTNNTDNSEIKDLIEQYNSLYEQKRQGINVDNELATAAQNLATKYGIQGAAVATLKGNYEELIKTLTGQGATQDKFFIQAKENLNQVTGIVERGGDYTANQTEKKQVISNTKPKYIEKAESLGYRGYIGTSATASSRGLGGTYQDFSAAKLTSKFQGNKQVGKDSNLTYNDLIKQAGLEDFTATTRNSWDNSEDLVLLMSGQESAAYQHNIYTRLLKLRGQMDSLGVEATDGLYQQVNAILNSMQSNMELYEKALAEFSDAQINNESLKYLNKTAGKDYDIAAFLSDYQQTVNDFMQTLAQTQPDLSEAEAQKKAIDAANAVVGANDGLNSYNAALQMAYAAYGNLEEAGKAVQTLIQDYGITPEQIDSRMFSYLQDESGSGKEMLDAMVKSAKANQEYITAMSQSEAAKEAKKKLKENMTNDEVSELRNAIDWGENGIIAWEDFYTKSYEEKTAYLKQLSEQYTAAAKQANQDAIDATEAEVAAAKKARDNYSVTLTDQTKPGQWVETGRWTEEDGTEIIERVEQKVKTTFNADDVALMNAFFEDEIANYISMIKDGTEQAAYDAWKKEEGNSEKTERDYAIEQMTQGGNTFTYWADGSAYEVPLNVLETWKQLQENVDTTETKLSGLQEQKDIWAYQAAQTEAFTTKVQRLSDALKQLPSSAEDFTKLAAQLGVDEQKLSSMTSKDIADIILKQGRQVKLEDYQHEQTEDEYVYEQGKHGISAEAARQQYNAEASHKTVTDWAGYSKDSQAENQLFASAFGVGAKEDINTIQRAQEQLEALDKARREIIANGKTSEETNSLLRTLGISPSDVQDLEKVNTQIDKYKGKVGAAYASINKYAEDSGIKLSDIWTGSVDENGNIIKGEIKSFEETGLSEDQESSYQSIIGLLQIILELESNITDEELKRASAYNVAQAEYEKQVKALKQEAEISKEASTTLTSSWNQNTLDAKTQEQLRSMNLKDAEGNQWDASNWGSLDKQQRLNYIGQANNINYERQQQLVQSQIVQQSSKDKIAALQKDENRYVTGRESAEAKVAAQKLRASWEEGLKSSDSDKVKSTLMDMFPDDAAARAAMQNVINSITATGETLTWDKILAGLDESDLESKIKLAEIMDQQTQQIVQLAQQQAQAEEQAAQRAADAWMKAFDTLHQLRMGAAEGKTIAEMIFGDKDMYEQYAKVFFENNPDATYKDFTDSIDNNASMENMDPSNWLLNTMQSNSLSAIQQLEDGTFELIDSFSDYETAVKERAKKQAKDSTPKETDESEEHYNKRVDEVAAKLMDGWLNGSTMEQVYKDAKATAAGNLAYAGDMQSASDWKVAEATYNNRQAEITAGLAAAEALKAQNNKINSGESNKPKAVTQEQAEAISKMMGKDYSVEDLKKMSNEQLNSLMDQAVNGQIEAGGSLQQAAADLQTAAAALQDKDKAMGEKAVRAASDDVTEAQGRIQTPEELAQQGAENTEKAFSSMESPFKQLEDIQTKVVDTKKSVGYNDIQQLDTALKSLMSDPAVADAFHRLEEGAIANDISKVTQASHDLTTAIIQGNGEMLESSEAAELMLKSWKDTYGITDKYGNALTVAAVNQMRLRNAINKGQKSLKSQATQMKINNKQVTGLDKSGKKLSKTFDNMETLYDDVAKAAKDANMSIEDYVDQMSGLSKEEKAAVKYGAQVREICNDLGEGFDNMKAAMLADSDAQTVGTAFLKDMTSYMQAAGIDAQQAISTLGNALSTSLDGFAAETASQIGVTEEQVNQAVAWLKDNLSGIMAGTVDMGQLAGILGGDFSNVAALLQRVAEAYGLSAEIPGLEEFLAYVSKAMAAASKFNSIGGGGGPGGGGARNAMPTNNKPDSGSGGGGGDKQKQTKDLKELEDVLERYHEIEQILKRTNEQLDEIDKLKERSYGTKYLKNVDNEIKKLRELSKEQEQYLNEAQEYWSGDRLRMASIGATFDEEGNINNYDEMIADWVDTYNRAIEAYNNGAQEDADKVALDNAEKEFERRQKWLDQYEDSIDKVHEKQNELLDLQNQISEAALDKVTYQIEYTINVRDKDLELLEYYSSTYEDVLDKQDADMYNRLGRATEYEQTLSTLSGLLTQLEQDHINGIINDAGYKEGLESIFDEAKTAAEGLKEVKDELKEIYEKTLSLADEELDKHTTHLDNAKSALESYVNITGLLGQGPQYKQLSKYYEQINKNDLINLQLQKEKAEAYQKEMDYINSLRDAEGKLTEIQQERYNTLQTHLDDAYTAMLDQVEATLEDIQTAYENTIDGIFDDWDKSVAGNAGSLSNLADSYGYFAETQERTLSAAQQLHDISKLNRDIEKSMDDATNKAAKEQLKALQDTINLKAKNNQLTKYDIDLMNLQYQLLLKQQALEDAADAKEVVRLTRDANGNYGYQYTADADKLATAQQEYEDVLQQINELSSNHLNETAQKLVDIQNSYKESALSIAKDTTLTEEEKQRKLEELAQRYDETMTYYVERYTDASEHLQTNQEAIAKHYGETIDTLTSTAAGNTSEAIDEMIKRSEDIKQAFKDAIGDENGGALGALKGFGDSIGNVAGLLKDMDVDTAKEKITALIGAMGDSMANFDKDNAQVMADATKALGTIADSLKDVSDATSAWEDHNSIIEATQKSYENLANSVNKALHELTGIKSANIFKQQEDLAAGLIDTITDPAQMTQKFTQAIEKAQSTIDDATIKALSTSYEASLQAMTQAFSNQFKDAAFLKDATLNIEQNIHMEVSFPNATNQEEITEAINNLANRAAQYVNQGLFGKSEG